MDAINLSDCTPLQKRYLHRHVCFLCDMRLDSDFCLSMYGPRCSEKTKGKRRADCLKHYKPRRREIIKADLRDAANR